MRGTVLCGVIDTDASREAVAAAVELCTRLDLRLVLAHVRSEEGTAHPAASDVLRRLAAEFGVAGTAQFRELRGDAAAGLGRLAAEEAADVILVGARSHGRVRGRLESRLARDLESETAIPVLIAPPIATRESALRRRRREAIVER